MLFTSFTRAPAELRGLLQNKHLLEHKLLLLLYEYKNPIAVYFWGGTCDITKKQGTCKYIDIRGKSGDIIPAVYGI